MTTCTIEEKPVIRTSVAIPSQPFGDDLPSALVLADKWQDDDFKPMIKEMRKRMKAFYKEKISGTTWLHPILGIGTFDNGSKIISTSASAIKIALVYKLPEILVSSRYVEALPHLAIDERHQRQSVNVRQWHWLTNHISIENEDYEVGLHVREDNSGMFHYNINHL